MTTQINQVELTEFLEREQEGLLEDLEMVGFIDRNVINKDERAEFKRRKISIAGALTGKYACTVANERMLVHVLARWNKVLGRKVFFF